MIENSDERGGLEMYCKMRKLCGKSVRIALYVYDAYGNTIEKSGEKADEHFFGFSTKYHDREIGIIAYQKRFYCPDYGRWLSRDPIEEEGGENLYAFCGNNPI